MCTFILELAYFRVSAPMQYSVGYEHSSTEFEGKLWSLARLT